MSNVLLHPTEPVALVPHVPPGFDVARFLAYMDRGRVIERNGKPMLAAPHHSDNVVRMLRMGLDAPTSIRTRYDWTGRYTPFTHQVHTAEFFTLMRRCICLNEMGTGKTSAALWAADHLLNEGLIRSVLVFAPLSCLDSVWDEEMFISVPHRSRTIVHGKRDRRIRLVKESAADFIIMNHDAYRVTGLFKALSGKPIDLVIYDEASALRDPGTTRYKTLLKDLLRKLQPRLWLMTGTPTPNAPSDAWALARLINPFHAEKNPQGVQSSFIRFRDSVMTKAGPFRWRPRATAAIIVRETLKPAVHFEKKDCVDIPPMLTTSRRVEITPEQAAAYKEMKNKLQAAARDEDGNLRLVTAVNAAGQLLKILQLLSGAAYLPDKSIVTFDMSTKLAGLKEIIEQASKKVLVMVPFTHTNARIREYLHGEGITCDVMTGKVTGQARGKLLSRFMRERHPRVLIAHPKTASHGLNLTVCDTICWFGPTMSAEQYQQGCERLARPGQDMKMLNVHLSCHPVERKYFQLLMDRQNLQRGILNLYREILDE